MSFKLIKNKNYKNIGIRKFFNTDREYSEYLKAERQLSRKPKPTLGVFELVRILFRG